MNKRAFIILFLLFFPLISRSQSREQCAEIPGKEWSSKYNRCVNTQQATEVREDHEKCNAIKSEKKRIECLEKSVKGSLNLDATTGKVEIAQGWSAGLPVVALNAVLAGIVAATGGIEGLGEFFFGGCLHRTLFAATSLAHLASEIWFTFFAENELTKFKEEFDKKDQDGKAYDVQIKAYEYLEKEQTMIKDVAEQRSLFYLVIAAGYGATVVTAVVEMISQNPACGLGGEGGGTPNDIPTEAPTNVPTDGLNDGLRRGIPGQYLFNGNRRESLDKIWEYLSPLKSAHASIGGLVKHPLAIMTLAGIGAGVTGALSWHAHQEALKAEKTIKEIQKIKKAFQEQARSHCFEGRDHIVDNDPQCYCYTKSGTKNPAQEKNKTCQKIWDEEDRPLYAPATDYNLATSQGQRPPCVGGNGKIDKKCSCQKKTGKGNSCLRVSTNAPALGNLAQAISYPTVFDDINKAMSGSLEAAKINGAAMKKSAARSKKITDSLLKKINKNRRQPLSLDNKIKSNFIKAHTSKKALAKARNSSLNGLVSSIRPSKGKNAARLKKTLKQVLYKGGKRGKGTSRGKKKNFFAFNESAQNSKKALHIAGENDGKKYNFGDDDINKENNVPIWQIISKRYNISAYPRLFE